MAIDRSCYIKDHVLATSHNPGACRRRVIGVSGQGVMVARGQQVIGSSGRRVIVSSSDRCTGYGSRNGSSIHSRWIAEALT